MGFLNKLKGVFFEEEIVEVEDEPKTEKKESPVAKKIELPKAERKAPQEDIFEEENITQVEPEKKVEFQSFEDDDFRETKEMVNRVREQEKDDTPSLRRSERHESFEFEEEPELVQQEKDFSEKNVVEMESEPKYDFELEYGKNKEEETTETHGLYEGKSSKKTFTPTPVISPVFGILDKNYKKDDVVTKKEVRLSSISSKKMDLDSVREKAYGDLTNDISQSMEDLDREEGIVDLTDEDDDNLLYDLNDDASSPELKEVTVGDAEEYFNDLGLEYNIDYKDTSTLDKNKTTKEKTRRSTRTKDKIDKDEDKTTEEEAEKSDEMDSNLFDLIESMYDEKE